MKDKPILFDFTMTAMCPECRIKNNFEDHDEGKENEDMFFYNKFMAWINNEENGDKICTVVNCQHCERDFRLTEIVR